MRPTHGPDHAWTIATISTAAATSDAAALKWFPLSNAFKRVRGISPQQHRELVVA